MILLFAACQTEDDKTPTSTSETDTPTTDSAPTTTTTTTTTTDTAGGPHTGVVPHSDTGWPSYDLADLVPGTWQPVSITQGGVTTPIADDPARYLLLDWSGSAALGCGTAPLGTWAFDPYGPYPSIGIIQVDLGFPLEWYVLTLDATTLVYVEGGDQFDFARTLCP